MYTNEYMCQFKTGPSLMSHMSQMKRAFFVQELLHHCADPQSATNVVLPCKSSSTIWLYAKILYGTMLCCMYKVEFLSGSGILYGMRD